MFNPNRFRAALACFLLIAVLLLSGCGSSGKHQLSDDKLNVVVTFYPLYDFALKIGGDRVHVINLVPAGVDSHDWSPKSRDISLITRADLFVYHGVGFEGWVEDVLASLSSDARVKPVKASSGIALMPLHETEEEPDEHVEGQHGEHHHDHGGYDPHTWLSPNNAKVLANNIKDALIAVDPEGREVYETRYEELAQRLTNLDQQFREKLEPLARKEIVVTHRSFGYLARDYGLTLLSIMGLTPDAEPTAQDIKRINDFIKTHQVQYIFYEQLVSDDLAAMLARDAGIETLVLHPLEGLTEKELAAGEDYFSLMEANLNNLLKALQ